MKLEQYTPTCSDGLHTFIDVNGVQMGVIQRGRPVDINTKKPTIVLLHGFTGSAAGWCEQLDYFANAGFRAIALDMLGHGHSDAPLDPQRYSIEHCAADIIVALQALGVGPGEAILLGYSMGGRIALYTALSGYFRALILESASPGLTDPVARQQRQDSDNTLAERIERDGIEAFVTYWENIPLFTSQQHLPQRKRAELHRQRLTNCPSGLANSLRGVGTGAQPALHDRLSQLNIPVLLITGALDKKFGMIAESMTHRLPQARWCVVQNAGHMVHLEQPDQFAMLVLDFCMLLL